MNTRKILGVILLLAAFATQGSASIADSAVQLISLSGSTVASAGGVSLESIKNLIINTILQPIGYVWGTILVIRGFAAINRGDEGGMSIVAGLSIAAANYVVGQVFTSV